MHPPRLQGPHRCGTAGLPGPACSGDPAWGSFKILTRGFNGFVRDCAGELQTKTAFLSLYPPPSLGQCPSAWSIQNPPAELLPGPSSTLSESGPEPASRTIFLPGRHGLPATLGCLRDLLPAGLASRCLHNFSVVPVALEAHISYGAQLSGQHLLGRDGDSHSDPRSSSPVAAIGPAGWSLLTSVLGGAPVHT